MKTQEQLKERLSVLKNVLKETIECRMIYSDKQIKISSIKAKIDLLEWILS